MDDMNEIYFAGGCFWGTQHFLKQINGVLSTEVGYANGNVPEPTYEQVYTDATGYAEAVRVVFDASVVSLEFLIKLYFCSIDPTSLNRQGGDVGTRYRTGIYYCDSSQLPVIEEVCQSVAQTLAAPMVVEVLELKNFYRAEEYHQDYLDKTPDGYCHISRELMAMARKANAK